MQLHIENMAGAAVFAVSLKPFSHWIRPRRSKLILPLAGWW